MNPSSIPMTAEITIDATMVKSQDDGRLQKKYPIMASAAHVPTSRWIMWRVCKVIEKPP